MRAAIDNCKASADRHQCDERNGGCSNCERYGVSCPGYQDKFDVLLRLRTPSGAGLPRAKSPPSTRGEDRGDSEKALRDHQRLDRASVASQNTCPTSTINRHIGLDLDYVALSMYYRSNCVDGSAIWSLEHIRTQGNGCLFAAIKVLGNIAIFQRWSLPDGSVTVSRGYFEAIQLLNSALASPSEAPKDSTLLATMIMTAVETKAAPSQSLHYWEMHTKGAAALLQLRGVDQVTSRLGSALFFQVSNQLTTTCILAGRRIPQELQRLRNAVRVHLIDPAHPVWKYQGAMFRFTDFVAAARTDVSELEIQDTQHIIANALAIYTDLLAVFRDAGSVWQYDISPSTKYRSLIKYEHVYHTVLAAQLWNGHRAAIVILCTIVIKIANRLPGRVVLDKEAQLFSEKAAHIINEVAVDTIAAVPQALTLIRSRAAHHTPPSLGNGHDLCDGRLAQHVPVFQETQADSQALPYMHGCPLQWSVYFAAKCEFVAPHIRECLLDVLEGAAKTIKVQQWRILAEKLRARVAESS